MFQPLILAKGSVNCCYSSGGKRTCMPPLETRTDSPGETTLPLPQRAPPLPSLSFPFLYKSWDNRNSLAPQVML